MTAGFGNIMNTAPSPHGIKIPGGRAKDVAPVGVFPLPVSTLHSLAVAYLHSAVRSVFPRPPVVSPRHLPRHLPRPVPAGVPDLRYFLQLHPICEKILANGPQGQPATIHAAADQSR